MGEDAIVIGGGIIGCSIALKLAGEGLKVTVIERGRLGREASHAAAGMLSPQTEATRPDAFFDLCLHSRALYPAFADSLTELSGVDIEYRDEGTLCVFLEDEEAASMRQRLWWQKEAGLRMEPITAADLSRWEPALTSGAAGALHLPDDHQVENRKIMAALRVAVERAGVRIIEKQEVGSILVERGRATGVATARDKLHAGEVVVAAGSWSSHLLGPAGIKVKIIPARGQMIAVRCPRMGISHVLHSNRCYVVPRKDGRVLIGATVERAGFDKAITVAGIKGLLEAGTELIPSFNDCEIVEAWSGLRPDTPDHLPVLGSCGVGNLWLATGHYRNGILLAPVTADLMTRAITSGRAPGELTPFSVGRFDAVVAAEESQSPEPMARV